MTDSYYTPTWLADLLVSFVQDTNVLSVADFCVGNGDLLLAASSKWPEAVLYGTDISEEALAKTRKSHNEWKLGKCDFLSVKSRSKCKILRDNQKFDLVLMNPPFSCVGGTRRNIQIGGQSLSVSTSMAFLLEALKYVNEGGHLFAIMPNSVAFSEKDARCWNLLVENYELQVHDISTKKYFDNCSPHVILISLRSTKKELRLSQATQANQVKNNYNIFRGKVRMFSLNGSSKSGHYLIHTTNLKDNSLENLNYRMIHSYSKLQGPAVLIPRVGNPTKEKVCVIGNQTYILSDCVLAIKTVTIEESISLKNEILDLWDQFSQLYQGTGAKYTTLKKVSDFVNTELRVRQHSHISTSPQLEYSDSLRSERVLLQTRD